jgi:hypothetical protein
MPFLRNELGQMIRKDGTVVERAGKGRSPGVGKRTTQLPDGQISHLRVDKILGGSGPLRDEYERRLENPNTYIKHLQAWLAERGHHVNISAINTHRKRHIETFKKVRASAQEAAVLCDIVRKQGGSFVEAAQGHFEMKLMQTMSRMADDKELPAEQAQVWCKTLAGAVAARRSLEELRAEYERRAAEAAKAGEAEVKKGATGKDVVARMREILGV